MGLVKKITVQPAYQENGDGDLKQPGHEFDSQFRMKIVGDKLAWNDEGYKSQGCELKNGKSHKKMIVLTYSVTAELATAQ